MLVASLMSNGGMPGVIISPESSAGNVQPLKKEQRDELRDYWDENFGGQNRGRPFIHNLPIKVQFPAYNPQQMILDKVRAIPEQRIAGAFGLPMSVLQLGSGVVNSNSRANKSDDRKQAYESCIIPTSKALASELTRALLSEFGDITSSRVWFDTSDVSCLEGDENELAKILVLASGGPYMTPNEARKRAGLKPIEGGEKLRDAKAAAAEQKPEEAGDVTSEDENDVQNDTAKTEQI
ncbi:MAG: phage portal protein [Rhizobiaceae bacterium]|nr:MAG: phage portal protein [Rhizobiaceae bacterium]